MTKIHTADDGRAATGRNIKTVKGIQNDYI